MIANSLYQLQQIDDTIRAGRRRLAEVEDLLGESQALRKVRAAVDRIQDTLRELEKKQRMQELELQQVADKLDVEEGRLYSGRVKNPKELAGIQKEVRYLQQKRADLEDSVLETMMSRDEVARIMHEQQSALDKIETDWSRDQARLMAEREELQAAIEEANSRRMELVAQIPASALSTYDYLLRTKGFAVAPVEGGMCTGCRVSLSAVDRQRVRTVELATCDNCGRVLVVL